MGGFRSCQILDLIIIEILEDANYSKELANLGDGDHISILVVDILHGSVQLLLELCIGHLMRLQIDFRSDSLLLESVALGLLYSPEPCLPIEELLIEGQTWPEESLIIPLLH